MGTIRTAFFALCLAGATTFAQDAAQLQPPVFPPETIVTPAPEATIAPATTAAPAPKPAPAKPKKPAAPTLPTARGSVAKLDNVAMTITVNAKGKDETFKVTSKTRVFADGIPAIFADGKVGENAIVEFQNSKDKASKEALTIRFGGSAPASDKVAPKKPAGKKPAAKKADAPKHDAVHDHAAPDAASAPVTPQ